MNTHATTLGDNFVSGRFVRSSIQQSMHATSKPILIKITDPDNNEITLGEYFAEDEQIINQTNVNNNYSSKLIGNPKYYPREINNNNVNTVNMNNKLVSSSAPASVTSLSWRDAFFVWDSFPYDMEEEAMWERMSHASFDDNAEDSDSECDQIETSAASYESAIIGEAHGLVTDMLVDETLPPHIVSGLRAVSNLLKPPDNHVSVHKPKVSPLVSLTESPNYGSDTEDLPYTGERPTTLPKRLRRSLPPSLIRRMSTSTWTTTTSATGMPTLEAEPCRVRSSSFRHTPREGTPGSSPVGSRSNSPSPGSPTTVTLTIPKARSFSTPANSPIQNQKRQFRKSMAAVSIRAGGGEGPFYQQYQLQSERSPSPTKLSSDSSKPVSPLVSKDDISSIHMEENGKTFTPVSGEYVSSKSDPGNHQSYSSVRRLNITSDYESSDSPSSSDHSDNVVTGDDLPASPPTKVLCGDPDRISPITGRTIPEECSDSFASDTVDSVLCEIVDKDDSADDLTDESQPVEKSVCDDLELLFDVTDVDNCNFLHIHVLNEWDYQIFDLVDYTMEFTLSKMAYKLFQEVGLFETFRIPLAQFMNYFHELEIGYQDKPYHNRVHAADVLHGVYFLSTQAIPGFQQVNCTDSFARHGSSSESESEGDQRSFTHKPSFSTDDTYGIMGANFPALELMALYTAAAMHDYDHPGRTNAFLVTTHAPQAVLYNDRSVLENHHAASAWRLFLSNPKFNFLSGLDAAEFKRFRFLVIEAILATDLKRHFEILAEFNAKVNDDDATGIDWTVETDRMLVSQMVIKLADINGPAKTHNLHFSWTMKISEEFYEQGDEEARLGMPISPYMDRQNPQLAKLQESFINHLVAPLCNSMVTAGLVPGTWVEEDSDAEVLSSDTEKDNDACKDTEDDTDDVDGDSPDTPPTPCKATRKIHCILTKNLHDNHEMWVQRVKEEELQKASCEVASESTKPEGISESRSFSEKTEMETIKEETESPNGLTKSLPSPR